MVGNGEVVNEEVVGEVKLKLTEDPHIGSNPYVMRTTIGPDLDDADANKVSTLHELLPDPSYKFDTIGDPFLTNKIKVDSLRPSEENWDT